MTSKLQFKVRLDEDLHNKIKQAADENKNSVNTEIVQRLEMSLLNEIPADKLISAKEAKQIADNARDELSTTILKRTFEEINKKARLGQTKFFVDLEDLDLEGLDSDEDFIAVFQLTFSKLKEMGYRMIEGEWDSEGFMAEIPDD